MEFRGLKAFKVDGLHYVNLDNEWYAVINGKVTKHALFNGYLIIDLTGYSLDSDNLYKKSPKSRLKWVSTKGYDNMCLLFRLLGYLPCNEYDHWLYDSEVKVSAHDYFDMSMRRFVENYV